MSGQVSLRLSIAPRTRLSELMMVISAGETESVGERVEVEVVLRATKAVMNV